MRQARVISPNVTVGTWLNDLWKYRNVLLALCHRDIKGKYKQAFLGITWAAIQPVIQVGLFTLVFKGVAKVDTPAPYPLFVLTGLLPFNLFQQIVGMGTPAFVSAQSIVSKVYFPRLYTVIAGSSSALLNGAITLTILTATLIGFRQSVSARLILAVPMMVGVLLLSLGLAAVLSAVNARFRDVQHALPLMMSVLIYVSPVLYPLESVPGAVRPLVLLNPVTGLVDGLRFAIIGVEPYSWWLVVGALAASVCAFVSGVWFFERTQAKSVDIL